MISVFKTDTYFGLVHMITSMQIPLANAFINVTKNTLPCKY